MTDRLTQLTPAQTAALATTRDQWLAHGLSTAPADRAQAEVGVAEAYRAAGLEPPAITVWLDSPFAGVIGAHMLTTLRDQVRGQVGDQVRGQVRQQIHRAVWGQHDAGWLSFYDYFRTHTPEITGPDRLSGLIQVAQSAGWWWPFRGAVILTERPTALHRDAQERLHREDGPALAYPDGFSIWAWHGVRVPRDLIERGWGLTEILAEPNAEIRRCAIEKLGWDQFIRDSGLTKVASAPDPGNHPYHLALYDLPDQLEDLYEEPARILLCTNGSPEPDGEHRRFGLPVPAYHTDPVAAAAEMYGWPTEAYRQLQVRR